MTKYNINKLVSEIDFDKNKLVQVNKYLLLTNYQINILERYKIDYKSLSSIRELIYIIEDIWEETLDEELEIILDELSERNYYENTKK